MAFKIPKAFLRALGEAKKYTPADPKIREMMLKAGLGIDLKNPEKSALPGMGGLRSGRAFGKPPLEFGGPKPSSPPAKIRGRNLEQALASSKYVRDRPRIPTGLSAQAKAKRGEPHGTKPEDRHVYKLPARTKLFHSSYHGDAIRKEGFRPSRNGESGPGVYLAPNKYVAKNYPDRDLLKVRPNKELRLLDRTTVKGEKIFRKIQGYTTKEGETMHHRLKEAGYDGVHYRSGGRKDPEIVVHDPKVLKSLINKRAKKPRS
jgi:hypothetical protein